jgi:hypothetical protein
MTILTMTLITNGLLLVREEAGGIKVLKTGWIHQR